MTLFVANVPIGRLTYAVDPRIVANDGFLKGAGLKRLIASVTSILLAVTGCKREAPSPIQSALLDAKVGEVTSLAHIAANSDSICFIYPTQMAVSSSVRDYDIINKHLIDQSHVPDEGSWEVLFVKNRVISSFSIKRSSRLDVFARHEISGVELGVPKNFRPASNCASAEKAAIYKVVVNNRNYVILGEI